MPGLALRLLVQPVECAAGSVYEHAQAGVFLDLYTRDQDGTGITFVSVPDRGLEQQRAARRSSCRASAPPRSTNTSCERTEGPRVPRTPETLLKFFADAYAEQSAWRKRKGISAQEVANLAKTRRAG